MNYRMMTVTALLVALPACAQKKKAVINDSNTPLHLLQPAYQGTYGDLTPEQVLSSTYKCNFLGADNKQ